MAENQDKTDKASSSNNTDKAPEPTTAAQKATAKPRKSTASAAGPRSPKTPKAKSKKTTGAQTSKVAQSKGQSSNKSAETSATTRKKPTAPESPETPAAPEDKIAATSASTPPAAPEKLSGPTIGSASSFQETAQDDEAQNRFRPDPSSMENHDSKSDDSQRWLHGLYRFFGILVFGFISYFLLMAAWICSAIQFFVILIQQKPNQQLFRLMSQISAYIEQILNYLAGRTDATDLPFPLGALPEPHIKADRTSKTERHNS